MSPILYLMVVPLIRRNGQPIFNPTFILNHLHTARADGAVYVLIDPSPWDCGHLRQIDEAGSGAHMVIAMPVSRWHTCNSSHARVAPT